MDGHGEGPRLVAREEEQLASPPGVILARLAPGAREWRVMRTTDGEKAPERTEEHGDQVRLRDDGAGEATQLLSLSQPSDRIDSRDDDTREVSRSTEVAGLNISSRSGSES